MPYTLTEAQKLELPALAKMVAETLVGYDPLLANLPLTPVQGNAIVYNQENSLGGADHYAVGATLTAATPTYDQITEQWRFVDSDQVVAKLINAVSSDHIPQILEAIRRGTKAVAREIMNALINGLATNDEPTGLDEYAEDTTGNYGDWAAQSVGATIGGGVTQTISFDLLDQLLDTADVADRSMCAFIMPRRTVRSYKALLRSLGGTHLDQVVLPTGNQLAYEGVPVFWNDFMSTTLDDSGNAGGSPSNESRIYLVSFEEGNGSTIFVPQRSPQLVDVEIVETMSNQDSMIARCKAYYGFAVRSYKAFAYAPAVTN